MAIPQRTVRGGSHQAHAQPAVSALLPWRSVALVAGVALAFRAFYASLYRGSPFFFVPVVDASTFHLWAQAINDGTVFAPGVYSKPPLYPYCLAAIYKVFSPRPEPVYAIQALLGAGTCVATLALGQRFFAPRVALAGALIYALLPIPASLEFQLLAEPLTTFLTMAALLLLVIHPARASRTALAGALLGIATLGRPNLLILVPVLAGWLWFASGRRRRAVIALVLGAALAIAPTTLHNLRAGAFVPVSANGGVNLWTGVQPGADGVTAIPIGIRWDDALLQAKQSGARDNVARDAWFTRQAWREMARDPLRTARLLGRKALLLVNAHEGRNNIGADFLGREQGVAVLHRWWPSFWLMAPVALLGLAALAWPRALAETRPRGLAPLLLVLATLAAAILPFFVIDRFRQPMLPLLALFAAYGATVAAHAMRGRGRAALLASGLLVGSAVVVNVDWFDLARTQNHAIDELNLAGILAKGYGDHPPDLPGALGHLDRAARLDPENPDIPERRGLYLQAAAADILAVLDQRGWQGPDVPRLAVQARQLASQSVASHRRALALFPRSFRSHGSEASAHLLLGLLASVEARGALAAGDTAAARERALAALAEFEADLRGWAAALAIEPELSTAREGLAAGRGALGQLPDLDPAITAAKARLTS